MAQAEVYANAIAPNAPEGAAMLFAHGFSIHYGRVSPRDDMDVILVAPKGPGDLVRREYARGRGVPCLFAVEQDATGKARDRALGYARGIGGGVGGILETTFAEETETDLFGEQAVLCGGATELVKAGFETLVDAGYQPEIAYFECLHELKLIVDLMYEGGISKMRHFISETAKYGDVTSGPRVINEETRARMREVLADIQSGSFAREWILENQAGRPRYHALLRQGAEHQVETVGADLRAPHGLAEQRPPPTPPEPRVPVDPSCPPRPPSSDRHSRCPAPDGREPARVHAGAAGGGGRVRLSGRGDHAGLRRPDRLAAAPHPGPPRAERGLRRRRLRPGHRPAGRLHGDLGPGRDQPDHRHRQRHDGLRPAGRRSPARSPPA